MNLVRFAHNWNVGILERWPALARRDMHMQLLSLLMNA